MIMFGNTICRWLRSMDDGDEHIEWRYLDSLRYSAVLGWKRLTSLKPAGVPRKKKWFDENGPSLCRRETSIFEQDQEIWRQLQPCNLQNRVSGLPSRPGHVAE